jgi:hypothetical protein
MAECLSSGLCWIYERYLVDRNSFQPKKKELIYFDICFRLFCYIIYILFVHFYFRFVWPNIFLTVTPFYPEKGVTLLILYLVWFGMQNVVLQISILVFVVLCLHTSGWKRRPADA